MSKHVGPTATDSDLNSLDGIKNDQPQALPLSRTGPEQETYRAADGSPVGKGGFASWKLRRSIVATGAIMLSALLGTLPQNGRASWRGGVGQHGAIWVVAGEI